MPATAKKLSEAKGLALHVPKEKPYPLSVDQYHAMIEAGILGEDEPVELLEGRLVTKMPKKPAHPLAKRRLRRYLSRLLPKGYFFDSQDPITTADSEPEPDGIVVHGDEDDFVDRHPGPAEVVLAAEVSESSLRTDRGSKKRLYARARIPVYWIINLVDRQVEVFSLPAGIGKDPDYRKRQVFKPGDDVPVVIRGRTVGRIPVRNLLP